MTIPTLPEVAKSITERYPIISNGLLPKWHKPGDPEWGAAEWALAYVVNAVESRDGIDQAIDAFAQTSIDFLRLQARFRKTMTYARTTADGLVDELYSDSDEMEGHYLDGLAMTYAMWPNHCRLLDFYRREFLTQLPHAPTALEIGPGHGLLGFTLLTDRPGATYTALDISEPALGFLEKAFAANDLEADIALVAGDATKLDDDRIPTSADAVVCCEVLEHVDQPERILEAVRDRLGPGGRAFVSTVANLEAIDHVYLFRDVDEIRNMIEDNGLTIVADRPMKLPGDDSVGFTPLNYVCITERTG
jgi:2-polyprenyl-3-methyl-5-hydroxy-6-metoxy-1,4-benzoquinol methylase